jgi:hypothetical protein
MSDREMRLECLKAAAATAPTFEVLKVAAEFWEFVSSGSPRSERQRTEPQSSDTQPA